MKDYVIIFITVIAIFLGGFFVEKYLINFEEDILTKLAELEIEISNGYMEKSGLVEEIEGNWTKDKNILHLLVNHQIVDEIEGELKKMKKNYELKDEKETILNIIELKFRIEDIHKGECFALSNIL